MLMKEYYIRVILDYAEVTAVKDITRLHGLVISKSNASLLPPHAEFRQLVRLSRSPTGKTADGSRRIQRATFYFDAKWLVLYPAEKALLWTHVSIFVKTLIWR